jgi:nucleoside-diphosphate-sugar epimerase
MKKILVTGGLGKAAIKKLLEKNYNFFNFDFEKSQDLNTPLTCVDLENFGETVEAIKQIDNCINGNDAIIHQAAIPASVLYPNHKTFCANTFSTYNVLNVLK